MRPAKPFALGLYVHLAQSGVTGWLSIRSLREEGRELSVVHSVFQFFLFRTSPKR